MKVGRERLQCPNIAMLPQNAGGYLKSWNFNSRAKSGPLNYGEQIDSYCIETGKNRGYLLCFSFKHPEDLERKLTHYLLLFNYFEDGSSSLA